jgi:predicted metalloprotease with PDZ domain
MRFDVSLERRSEQRLTVRLTLDRDDCRAATGGGDRGEVELYQATWTPGSYLVREYSAFVDEVAHLTDDRFTPARKTKEERLGRSCAGGW